MLNTLTAAVIELQRQKFLRLHFHGLNRYFKHFEFSKLKQIQLDNVKTLKNAK